jgi:hypothetical protein
MREKEKDKIKQIEPKVIFCTECGTELDAFSLKEKAEDIDSVRKNTHNCKKIGKFKGEFCSKLFMADETNLDELWSKDLE